MNESSAVLLPADSAPPSAASSLFEQKVACFVCQLLRRQPPDHIIRHCPSQIIEMDIDAVGLSATWVLYEHVGIVEEDTSGPVLVWLRGEFRSTTFSLTANGEPEVRDERTEIIHRSAYCWRPVYPVVS